MKAKIEDYKHGYPRLAAFLALDPNFTILNRFDQLHMRALLDQQDELQELEEKLNRCDDEERTQLNLSSRRLDTNPERRQLLDVIKRKLRNYDQSLLNFHELLMLPQAQQRHKQSLVNWFDGNKPLVRSESSFLLEALKNDDYIALNSGQAEGSGLEATLSAVLWTFPKLADLLRVPLTKAGTSDSQIYIFPRQTLDLLLKIVALVLIPLWLILPSILLLFYPLARRAVIYSIFTFGASFMMGLIAETAWYKLTLATVAYTAVISALLSGEGA